MKKGDVGMVNCFSKKYGNKGLAFNYLQSYSYAKMPFSAWCYIPTSLPPEPSIIFLNSGIEHSEACIQPWERVFLRYMTSPFYPTSVVFSSFTGGMVSHKPHPPQLWIILNMWIITTETILVLVACSWGKWCMDVAPGADRHLDITFGLQVAESSSLYFLEKRVAIPTSTFFI